MLKILDTFAGIGGFSYAAERLVGGYETAAFVEWDKKCQQVLAKNFPGVPIYGDIREFEYDPDRLGRIHIITGGYPCQPFSSAGKRRGDQDDRHLWPRLFEVVKSVRPDWVIGENVAGHITLGLDTVLSDLEAAGYATRPFIVPACGVDAAHKRDRVWIVAYSGRKLWDEGSDKELAAGKTVGTQRTIHNQSGGKGRGGSADVAHAESERLEDVGGRSELVREQDWRQMSKASSSRIGNNFWLPEPAVGRVANGIPGRVDRLKQLGNSIVPQVAARILWAIRETYNEQA